MREVARERDAGVLLVTHDLEAASLADRHVTLRDGRLTQLAQPAGSASPPAESRSASVATR